MSEVAKDICDLFFDWNHCLITKKLYQFGDYPYIFDNLRRSSFLNTQVRQQPAGIFPHLPTRTAKINQEVIQNVTIYKASNVLTVISDQITYDSHR